MVLLILKTCIVFSSLSILKRLEKEDLLNFRAVENLAKKYVKLEADKQFIQYMIFHSMLQRTDLKN